MNLLALIEAPNHVCYRYRLAAFADALAGRGWTLQALPLLTGQLQRAKHLRQAADADVVVLQRRLLPWWQLALLRRHAKILVYDCDDAVFLRDSNSPKEPLSRYRLAKFWATIQMADALIVGNRYLENYAAQFVPQEKIHRVPTCINLQRYPMSDHPRPSGEARLVWIGSRATLPSLRHVEDGLREAARRRPGIEFRVICDQFPRIPGIRTVNRLWSEPTEAMELSRADVGISWLPEHPWSQGKCGLKVLQYMAAGLPVVANPFGMHRQLVQHGRTGFLAKTPGEFAQAVQTLADDPPLRRRLGAAGRERVLKEFCADRWSRKFASTMENLFWSRNAFPACDEHLLDPLSSAQHSAASSHIIGS
ncbi:MAG: glycosyltransferase family 4 protein [Planctomycetales bacterium]